jgi:hypothetical protein
MPFTLILWYTLCAAATTDAATPAPTKFLKVIAISGDVAIKDLPETVYTLSTSQKVRVIHPITPAVIAQPCSTEGEK